MESCCSFKRLQYIACLLLAFTIIAILMVLFFYNYPTMAKRRVIDEVVFKNNTESMDRFENTKDLKNLRMAFYLFNVTNSFEVINMSAKIKLKEIGPFVYNEYKYKELIDNNQTSGLITYRLHRRYVFNRELSLADPKESMITWINVPLIVARSFLDKLNPIERIGAYGFMNKLIKSTNESSFMTDTAEKFLFTGSKRKFFEKLQALDIFKFVKPWPLKDNKFALLYDRNNTWTKSLDHEMTVSAGFGDNRTHSDLNKYMYVDGKDSTNYWLNHPPNCNAVGGTDGEFFSPFLDTERELEVYSSDICRKLTFKYDKRSYISGVPASQYLLDARNFQAPLNNSMNRCYCIQNQTDSPECRLDGLIDLSSCNQPNVIASGAHFVFGSPELLTRVDGVSPPDVNIHAPIIHVEPNTGLSIKVKVPIQFNIKLKKGGFEIFDWMILDEPTIVPLVWAEEMSELTESQASLLKSKLLLLDSWLVTMVLGGAIVLIVTIMAGATILCLKFRESRATEPRESDLLVGPAERASISSSSPNTDRADNYQTFQRN